MQKSISNGSGHARTHTKLNRIILVADTCLGTRPRLCLGSSSRAGCLSGSVQSRRTLVIPAECYASPLMPTPPCTNRSKSGLRPLQRAHPGNAGYSSIRSSWIVGIVACGREVVAALLGCEALEGMVYGGPEVGDRACCLGAQDGLEL